MSKDVLLPVTIRSPVVPFPSWPFSALPNAKTTQNWQRFRHYPARDSPFPVSVSTMEKDMPAEAWTTCSFLPPYVTLTIWKVDTSEQVGWPHYKRMYEKEFDWVKLSLPDPNCSDRRPRPVHHFRPIMCDSCRTQREQISYHLPHLSPMVWSNGVHSLKCIPQQEHRGRWNHCGQTTRHSPQCQAQQNDIRCLMHGRRLSSHWEGPEASVVRVGQDSWHLCQKVAIK